MVGIGADETFMSEGREEPNKINISINDFYFDFYLSIQISSSHRQSSLYVGEGRYFQILILNFEFGEPIL
jgi:hypothetical protein